MKRVLIYVQHLMGIGHLRRAMALAQGLHRENLAVTVITGSKIPDTISTGPVEIIKQPPMKLSSVAEFTFTDAAGNPIDENFKNTRKDHLLRCFHELRPDVLITELFPFGRRRFQFELLPLLEAADARRPRPLIVSSVRDILVETKQERIEHTARLIHKYYDLALVHGDADFIPLERTFPLADEISERVRYTGYVVSAKVAPEQPETRENEIVVSTGSGGHDYGYSVFECVLAARELSAFKQFRWRFLVSPGLAEERFQELKSKKQTGVIFERHRTDVLSVLRKSKLAIIRGGYNSVMDVYAAGIPAVIIPYSHRGEKEQEIRADMFQRAGRFIALDGDGMTPESMADAVDRAFAIGGNVESFSLNTDGVTNSSAYIKSLL